MAVFGLNNNLNNNYQAHSNSTGAQDWKNKMANSVNNINGAINAVNNMKSDNAFSRLRGIAEIVAMMMG